MEMRSVFGGNMNSDLFGKIGLLDVVDWLVVAFLIYQIYKLVRGTVAVNIFIGIIVLYALWLLVKALDMRLLGDILGQIMGVGVIALLIVFQQEIRRFLLYIGTRGFFSKTRLSRQLLGRKTQEEQLHIVTVVKACASMGRTKTGALVVLAKNTSLNYYAESGDALNADLSLRLLLSIFYKNNPLHDGAVIVQDNKILAARCILPLSDRKNFPSGLGLRHRAAVGITRNTDAVAVIVSEQNGRISYCKEGDLVQNVKSDKLKEFLEKEFE